MKSSRNKAGGGGSRAKDPEKAPAAGRKAPAGGETANPQPGAEKRAVAAAPAPVAQPKAETKAPRSVAKAVPIIAAPAAKKIEAPAVPKIDSPAAPPRGAEAAAGPRYKLTDRAAAATTDHETRAAPAAAPGAPAPEADPPNEWSWLTEPLKGIHQIMSRPLFDRNLVFGALARRDLGRFAGRRDKTGS
jgi:hypothetical protein